MIKITQEMLLDKMTGVSMRLPRALHNALKAEAALQNKTKDEFLKEIILTGLKK